MTEMLLFGGIMLAWGFKVAEIANRAEEKTTSTTLGIFSVVLVVIGSETVVLTGVALPWGLIL